MEFDAPDLQRIYALLVHLVRFERRAGEDDWSVVRRWLTTTESGRQFASYVTYRPGLVSLAAEQLRYAEPEPGADGPT